jgi:signal transduction histidine kinase
VRTNSPVATPVVTAVVAADRRARLPHATPRRLQDAALAAAPVLAGATILLALTSDHLAYPGRMALFCAWAVVAPLLIGVVWWRRRPDSRFGPLLVLFGFASWPLSLQAAGTPLLYDLGVLGDALYIIVTFLVILAFPVGRLRTTVERALFWSFTVVIVGFFVVWFPLSPVVAGGGPFFACDPACPDNVFQIGSAPRLIDVLGQVETYVALVVAAGIILVYLRRLATATRPQRRAFLAVAVTSLLFLPAFFAFHFSRVILELDQETLDVLAWLLVASRILFPLGFALVLVQAGLFAGQALERLLVRLAARPTPESWRDDLAHALDDDTLELGFWDPAANRYRAVDGTELPPQAPGREQIRIDRDRLAVAAFDVDAAVGEDPELIEAAAAATLLAVENGHLERELRASRARIVEAGDAERRRIGRDLHDSAQQRLVALRVYLGLADEYVERPEGHELVERLGRELDEALHELRAVASGVYPHVLAEHGIPAALRAVARSMAISASVTDDGIRRHSQPIELAIYFCCLEALQNAVKHAGHGAAVTIRLSEEPSAVHFVVADDGVGFDPAAVEPGMGLVNLADRLAGVGGTLHIDSNSGNGTRVHGHIPT